MYVLPLDQVLLPHKTDNIVDLYLFISWVLNPPIVNRLWGQATTPVCLWVRASGNVRSRWGDLPSQSVYPPKHQLATLPNAVPVSTRQLQIRTKVRGSVRNFGYTCSHMHATTRHYQMKLSANT